MSYVLGIETSCDETAAAILKKNAQGNYEVIAEEISSQTDLHKEYGGVVPELASREHLANLPLVLDKVLKDANRSLKQIDLLTVTAGPGLKGCLLIGLNFVKALSLANNIPFLAVNHIEGHALSAKLDNPEMEFPFLCLTVSGGHTEIVLVKAIGDYEIIARTSDDAAGEAFDKSANLLGLEYPGGASLSRLADRVTSTSFTLPRVMREAEGFSFSGLKTAISLLTKKHKEKVAARDIDFLSDISFVIQDSIVDALCFKLKQAVEKTGVRNIAVVGGVSANRELRKRATAIPDTKVYFAKASHCMDNAAMIAYTGALRAELGEKTNLNCEALARWPIEEMNLPPK